MLASPKPATKSVLVRAQPLPRPYPDGLIGQDIPVVARIFAVVDVFDALTSKRPYKEAMSQHEAMAIIDGESGGHFDPEVVAFFREIASDLYARAVQAGDAELRQEMRALISRYFKTVAAPAGAASRSGASIA